MADAISSLFIMLIMLAFFVLIGWHYWEQLHEEEDAWRTFVPWIARGLLFPALVWTAVNLGVFFDFAPLLPKAAGTMKKGFLIQTLALMKLLPTTIVVMGSVWAAVTFSWLQSEIVQRIEGRAEYYAQCGFWTLLMTPILVPLVYFDRIEWLGFGVLAVLIPLTHFTLPLVGSVHVTPLYAQAKAQLKFGKYADAEVEVINQLEKSPEDFEGWMMLAELYASQYHDLREAGLVVRQLCNQPNVTELQISMALNQLADWHLKFESDPVAARRALELICHKLPDTHAARMARLRMRQLPRTRKQYEEGRKRPAIALPAHERADGEQGFYGVPIINEEESQKLAERLQKRLNEDPADVSARERLAVVCATHFQEAGQAIKHLNYLLEHAAPSQKKEVEWLNLLATWQLKYNNDLGSARAALEQIVRKFPKTLDAFNAQRRLHVLELESRRLARQ